MSNCLKRNISSLINRTAEKNSISKEKAFVKIAEGTGGFLWNLYDYVERKYGLSRQRDNSSSLEIEGFLNSLSNLNDLDVDVITSTMNEHMTFEFILLYSVIRDSTNIL